MAISTDESPNYHSESKLLSPEDVLTICKSFVTVSTLSEKNTVYNDMWKSPAMWAAEPQRDHRIIGLSHLSVRDYLASTPTSTRTRLGFSQPISQSLARSTIAKGCFAYLMRLVVSTEDLRDPTICESYPLLIYIFYDTYWLWHVSFTSRDPALGRMMAWFVGQRSTALLPLYYSIRWGKQHPSSTDRLYLEQLKEQAPLLVVAYLGWLPAAETLVEAGADSDELSKYPFPGHPRTANKTALQVAYLTGQFTLYRYLLEDRVKLGVNCCPPWNLPGYIQAEETQTPLFDHLLVNGPDDLAIRQHLQSDMARSFLIEVALNVSAPGYPLDFAETLVHELEDGDRERKASQKESQTEHGHAGTNDPSGCSQTPSEIHGSLLHAAAYHGRYHMIQELLDGGVDVNLRKEPHLTALHATTMNGYWRCATLLLDRGADVNANSAKYGTALSIALYLGEQTMIMN